MRNVKSVKYRKNSVESFSSWESKLSDDIEANKANNTNNVKLAEPFVVYVDGPFGSPSSNIYRAEHAVLIGKTVCE